MTRVMALGLWIRGEIMTLKTIFVVIVLGAITCNAESVIADTCQNNQPDTCVAKCTYRNDYGSCMEYGADFCGPNASCVPNCIQRNTYGQCMTYGPDHCSTSRM